MLALGIFIGASVQTVWLLLCVHKGWLRVPTTKEQDR